MAIVTHFKADGSTNNPDEKMIRRAFTTVVAIAVLIGFGHNVQAQLYKWVDDNGDVHYSDRKPDSEIESSTVPGVENSFGYNGKRSLEPIVRPNDRSMRKLLVVDPEYLWKSAAYVNSSTKIGTYHMGEACTSRGAIMAPKVFAHHKKILATGHQLSFQASLYINSLDYESERNSERDLERRSKITNGLSLYSTIIDMSLKTCATSTGTRDRLKPVENIPEHSFTKNRVQLKVKWQLKSYEDQNLIYETVTSGKYDGWERRSSSAKAISHAMESAVMELFSNREFIDKILIEPGNEDFTGNRDGAAAENGGNGTLDSVIQRLIAWFSDILTGDTAREDTESASSNPANKSLFQGYLVNVFTELNVIKLAAVQHYATEGSWPQTLSQLEVSESVVSKNEAIDHVELKVDGRIVAQLRDKFGNAKFISLVPESLDGNAMMIDWRCESNLDPVYLPEICERI
jgi:hypothetical protein